MPRMTNAQRLAIASPVAGLQVFVTDFDGGSFMFYDGTKWGTLSFTKTIPDAPTIVTTAVAGIAEATVSFTAPSSNGGSAITFYTATSNPEDIKATLNQAGGGDITVTGLTKSTGYTFTVTATNTIGTSAASAASSSVVPDPLQVGDFYQGGVVFHLFEPGETGYVLGETHGLIAAVADQSSGIQWYNGAYVTTGTGYGVGTGSANTDAIIALQGAPATNYAAGLARAYNGGGYTDWFLPSKDELNKMYQNKSTINSTATANGGSNFSDTQDGEYWSSTEYSSTLAWWNDFFFNVLGIKEKYFTYYVRAVRAF